MPIINGEYLSSHEAMDVEGVTPWADNPPPERTLKPVDVQDRVLQALDMATGRTVPSIRRGMTTASGAGPGFRVVCGAVLYLERLGLVYQQGEVTTGDDVWPTYVLTAAGAMEAAAISRDQRLQKADEEQSS